MKWAMLKILFSLILILCSNTCFGQQMELPPEVRDWYHNFGTGSCVQCSIGMTGVWLNNPNAASLLWDSEFGPAEIGGSWPSRVAEYARRRQLKIYNVTGNNWEFMRSWFEWACRNGYYAAIGAGGSHFQTLYGWDKENTTWYVCNNNSPHKINEYSDSGIKKLHEASGYWLVILIGPSSPAVPRYINWWER